MLISVVLTSKGNRERLLRLSVNFEGILQTKVSATLNKKCFKVFHACSENDFIVKKAVQRVKPNDNNS